MVRNRLAPILPPRSAISTSTGKIGEQNQMIESALADRYRALETIKKCEKSAVISAWRLGQLLIEKKGRLTHGAWLPWLDSSGISASSASDYTRIARQIASAGNLKPSIRETLRTLPAPPTAKPKSKPAPAVVEPEPVETPEPDSAAVIEGLEKELYDAQERVAIMEEAADPKIRKAVRQAEQPNRADQDAQGPRSPNGNRSMRTRGAKTARSSARSRRSKRTWEGVARATRPSTPYATAWAPE